LEPVSVFTVPLSFRVDSTAWILAVGLLVALNATAFTWGAYPGQKRPAPRAIALLLTAAALMGLFASNLLTLAVAWGLLDLAFVVALLIRGGSEVGRRAALAIVFNLTSTVCVWIAALLIENQQGSLYWHLFNAPENARAWLMAAAVLELAVSFPSMVARRVGQRTRSRGDALCGPHDVRFGVMGAHGCRAGPA
jgi:formate hydrogenlyase subunit 3/multisubunit Na+/H+ antiporter MnhD subunit